MSQPDPTSFQPPTQRTLAEIVHVLRGRVAEKHLQAKRKGGKEISYVPHYTIAEYLDFLAPGWEWETELTVGHDRIYAVGKLTLHGSDKSLTRSATGTETLKREKDGEQLEHAYGDPSSNAEAMALRRSAMRFGFCRYLWGRGKLQTPQKTCFELLKELTQQSNSLAVDFSGAEDQRTPECPPLAGVDHHSRSMEPERREPPLAGQTYGNPAEIRHERGVITQGQLDEIANQKRRLNIDDPPKDWLIENYGVGEAKALGALDAEHFIKQMSGWNPKPREQSSRLGTIRSSSRG